MFSSVCYPRKKEHTLKNTVMSRPSKCIVFLGRTFSGHNHDYKMLKQEFPPDMDWFSDLHMWIDLGYQGIQSDYHLEQLNIPYKKPRKSQKNPQPALNAAQKAVNKALSQIRIGRSLQLGEGWHSSRHTVRFWNPLVWFQK